MTHIFMMSDCVYQHYLNSYHINRFLTSWWWWTLLMSNFC